MSGLFGGPKAVTQSAPVLSSLRITTSNYGRCLPLGWGLWRQSTSLLWYSDFYAHANYSNAGGSKGGGSGNVTSYDYSAAIILALCEGPINAGTKSWSGSDFYDGSTNTSSQTYSRTESVTTDGSAVAHLHAPATITAVNSVQAYNGNWSQAGDNGPSGGVVFLSPSDYTLNSGAGTVTFANTSLYANAVVTIAYTYTFGSAPGDVVSQLQLSLFKGTYAQTAWSWLTSNHSGQDDAYRGIAYLASSNFALGGGANVPNVSLEVDNNFGYSTTIRDCNPRDFLIDFMTNAYYGAQWPTDQLGDWTDYSNYCVASGLFLSPDYQDQAAARDILTRTMALTNSDFVYGDKKLKIVSYADQSVTGNGITWNPNLAAIYALTPDQFGKDTTPVRMARKSPDERYNQLKMSFKDRSIQYNDSVIDVKDEAEISRFGLRISPTQQDCPEIKDAGIATIAGNLILQRMVNVCNTFKFKLPFNYAALEPMDLVTLTCTRPKLAAVLVRITQIQENSTDEFLEIEAEEVPVGNASAILYPHQLPIGWTQQYNVPAPAVSAPVIFEAPGALVHSGLELYVAASSAAAHWGGCHVWLSLDGTNYSVVGQINGGSRYGHLTGAISGGTLPVVLVTGTLQSGSALDSAQLTTLCYIGGATQEYLGYQTATLTGAEAYDLTGLTRGGYGTSIVAHSTNDPFVRVDGAIGKSGAIDLSYIGKTVHVKLTSFNEYGGGEQDLSAAVDYTYTPTGAFLGSALAAGAGVVLLNGANMTIFGNSATKTGGSATTWDSSFYSSDGVTGSAFLSFVMPDTAHRFMVALNTDPLTDNNYTSLDYAWYCNGAYAGGHDIYESGSSTGVSIAAGPGAVFSITYDGRFVRYLINGAEIRIIPAAPGLKFFVDSSFYELGGKVTNVQFGPNGDTNQVRGGNLMDASWWKVGVSPISRWLSNQSGAGASDDFVNAAGPDGVTQPIWQATQGAGTNAGGGWQAAFAADPSNSFAIDTSKTYLHALYVQAPTLGGAGSHELLWGTNPNIVDDLNTTSAASNPYFAVVATHSMVAGRWYLMIGWVYPQASTGNNSTAAGTYDCTTGEKIGSGLSFNWHAGTAYESTRAFQFYGGAGDLALFCAPQVYVCDGSEPNLTDFLSMAPPSALNQLTSINASAYVANGALDTVHLALGAATEIYLDTPGSGVTVTGRAHTPDGFNSSWNTLLASVTFTPAITGKANAFFDARGSFTSGASPSGPSWSLQDAGGTYDGWKVLGLGTGIAAGTTVVFSMGTTRSFPVTGGVAYTLGVYAHKIDVSDTFTVDNIEFRVEVIKR